MQCSLLFADKGWDRISADAMEKFASSIAHKRGRRGSLSEIGQSTGIGAEAPSWACAAADEHFSGWSWSRQRCSEKSRSLDYQGRHHQAESCTHCALRRYTTPRQRSTSTPEFVATFFL